jgi:tRNA 2-thiouridine synthesizing protein A
MATKLDLSGLKCPLPALKTRKALRGLAPGERIEVVCTDPLASIDIPALLAETGDRLVATERQAGRIAFVIEKASEAADGGG